MPVVIGNNIKVSPNCGASCFLAQDHHHVLSTLNQQTKSQPRQQSNLSSALTCADEDFQGRSPSATSASPSATNFDRYWTVLTARGQSPSLQQEMETKLNAELHLLSHAYPAGSSAGQKKDSAGRFSLSVLHGAEGKVGQISFNP